MLERPGLTIRDVQTLLDQANVATTQVYTHVTPKELWEKVQAQDEPEPEPESDIEALRRELGKIEEFNARRRETLAAF